MVVIGGEVAGQWRCCAVLRSGVREPFCLRNQLHRGGNVVAFCQKRQRQRGEEEGRFRFADVGGRLGKRGVNLIEFGFGHDVSLLMPLWCR